MDEFDETVTVMTNEQSSIEVYEVPEPVDTWDLDDFEDMLA